MPVITAMQVKQTSRNFTALFFMILFGKIIHRFIAMR
jgi:hypothetical protein